MPVLVSVKVTLNGAAPFVGVAVKLATGTSTPAPITQFVESPPSLAKITAFVKSPTATGAKLTVPLVAL